MPATVRACASATRYSNRAFESSYPGHPRFEPEDAEVRVADLKAVVAALDAATADPDGRAAYPGDPRPVRRIANRLEVGLAGETHYLFDDGRFGPWGVVLERGLSKAGVGNDDPVNVSLLREIIDAVEPAHGLRPEVTDLIIIAWVLLRQRAWFNHGGAMTAAPAPGSLQPSMELRPQPMPTEQEWVNARAVAGSVFGIEATKYRTPGAVAGLSEAVRDLARTKLGDAQQLVSELEAATNRLGHDGGQRLVLARGVAKALTALQHQNGVTLIHTLGALDLTATAQESSASLVKAKDVASALKQFAWNKLGPVRQGAVGQDARAEAAQAILDRLIRALQSHEQSVPCAQALRNADDEGFEWLAAVPAPVGPGPQLPVVPPPITIPDDIPLPSTKDQGTRQTGGVWQPASTGNDAVNELAQFVRDNPGRKIEVQWRIVT